MKGNGTHAETQRRRETEQDRWVLAKMPKGVWFRTHELARVVSRARVRCERLASLGKLETRLAPDSVVTREYRVKNGTDGTEGTYER